MAQKIVTARGLWLAATCFVVASIFALLLMVVPSSEALMCIGPLVPLLVIGMMLGIVTRRVTYVDRDGLTVAWEPYGVVTLDLAASDIELVSVERVERTYLDIQDLFVGLSTIESYRVVLTLPGGVERPLVGGYHVVGAKRVADQIRAGLGRSTATW